MKESKQCSTYDNEKYGLKTYDENIRIKEYWD